MKTFFLVGALAATLPLLPAQSPLSTPMDSNRVAPAGSVVCFDLTIASTVTITSIDINTSSAVGTVGSLDVYVGCQITGWAGNARSPLRWARVATGSITSAGLNAISPCPLSPAFTLGPGTYAIGLHHIGLPPRYTRGTGANESYSTAEMTLTAGAVTTGLFTGTVSSVQVFNGNIHYTLGGTPLASDCAYGVQYGAGCYPNTPLQLTATARPVVNQLFSLQTSNIPPGTLLAALVFDFAASPSPISLASIGAPGCDVHLMTPTTWDMIFTPNGTTWNSLNSLRPPVGVSWFFQAAVLVPNVNPLGLLTSNGLEMVVGSR